MRSKLVFPAAPNGMPAAIKIVCPDCASPSLMTVAQANPVISDTATTSSLDTAWTLHTSARLRAVASCGAMPMIGAVGRSRAIAARNAPSWCT